MSTNPLRLAMPDPGDFQYYTVCGEVKMSTEQMETTVNQPAVACKQCEKVTFPRMKGVDDSPYCSSHCYNLYLGVGCAGYCAKCEREKRPMRSISFVGTPQMPAAASPNAACVG